MTNAELRAEIDALKAQLADASKPRAAGQLTVKRSEKGAVSVYGLGRFPVTLYAEQWTRLFASVERITVFIDANRANLSTKANPQQRLAALQTDIAAEHVETAAGIPLSELTDVNPF